MRRVGPLALSVLLSACGGEVKSPVDVAVLAFVPKDLKYRHAQATLNTVADLYTMRGGSADMVGGATLVINPDDPELKSAVTDEDIAKAVTKSPGGPVSLNFSAQGSVYFPGDFHSLNITTAYYNFERAFESFQRLGLAPADMSPPPRVFYFVELFEGPNATLEKDNAAYFPLLRAFLILPQEEQQQIPFPMNVGIVGHEYTHAVFDQRVFNRKELRVVSQWASQSGGHPGLNLMSSLNEGLADLFGTGVTCGADYSTCDTQFVAASIDRIRLSRDIDGLHCITQELKDGIEKSSSDTWREGGFNYVVGTVFASSIWRGARAGVPPPSPPQQPPKANVEAVLRAAYAFLKTTADCDPFVLKQLPTGQVPGLCELIRTAGIVQSDFRLSDPSQQVTGVLDAFVQQLADPKLALIKKAVCDTFLDRFCIARSDIPSCPFSSQSSGQCTCPP